MAPSKKQQRPENDERAKKTLYVTGFDSKYTTKHLLKELFTQGGPLMDIAMFDTHAYVRFQHEESVPYCLALFNEVELFGKKLRINPRYKSSNTFSYMKYLSQVRTKMRDEFMNRELPKLPPKKYPDSPKKDHRRDNRTATDNGKRRRICRGQQKTPSTAHKQRDNKGLKSQSINKSDTTSSAPSRLKFNSSARKTRGGGKSQRGTKNQRASKHGKKRIVKTLR